MMMKIQNAMPSDQLIMPPYSSATPNTFNASSVARNIRFNTVSANSNLVTINLAATIALLS